MAQEIAKKSPWYVGQITKMRRVSEIQEVAGPGLRRALNPRERDVSILPEKDGETVKHCEHLDE